MPFIKILDRRVLWLALALLASVNSWHMLVTMADREKYFVDEMWNAKNADTHTRRTPRCKSRSTSAASVSVSLGE